MRKTHKPLSVFGAKVESFFQTPAAHVLNVYNKRYKEQKCNVCLTVPTNTHKNHRRRFSFSESGGGVYIDLPQQGKRINRFLRRPPDHPSRGWHFSASHIAGRGGSQALRPWCSRASDS